MGEQPPTVLMIGVGGFGSLWTDAIAAVGFRVVAGIDPDPAARATFAREFAAHEPALLTDIGSFEGTVDYIIDSAPPDRRAQRISALIDRTDCMIVAKPAVPSLADLDRLLSDLGTRAGKVRVAMQKRHLPAFEALSGLLRSGALGDITYLRSLVELDGTFWEPGASWRKTMAHPNLWEGAIHQLDLLYEWMPNFELDHLSAFGWTPKGCAFSGISDFNTMARGRDGCVAQIVARWSVTRLPITHYFEGTRIEGSIATAEVHGGRLLVDGTYLPVPGDGDDFMDVARLNTRFAPHLFDLGHDGAQMGLARHRRVLSLADKIQTALEA